MSHSTHVGFREPPITLCRLGLKSSRSLPDNLFARGVGHILTASLIVNVRLGLRRAGFCPNLVPLLASGVGHNPDPLPEVRRIDGTSRNPKHCDLITKGFQVSAHLLDPQMEEPRHIFTKEPSGPENGETADHFRPEVTLVVCASSLPGTTDWLAREASAHEVNGLDPFPIDSSDVVVTGHGGPVLFEDLSTVLIDFNLPRDFKTNPF